MGARLRPVGPGQAAVTTGGALQASHVIHVVGPRYRDGQDNAGLLEQAVVAALDAAAETGLESVAMPAISAGVFGYPRREAASVIAGAVITWLEGHPNTAVREVRLVGYDKDAAVTWRPPWRRHDLLAFPPAAETDEGEGMGKSAGAAGLGLRAQVGRLQDDRVERRRTPDGLPQRQAAAALLPGVGAGTGRAAGRDGGRR